LIIVIKDGSFPLSGPRARSISIPSEVAMKKIRLDPESLEVVSFSTANAPAAQGTVKGAHTGYTCYETVGWQDTVCLAYPESYWGEENCRAVEATDASCDTLHPCVTAYIHAGC
jgi:hypothetical protein